MPTFDFVCRSCHEEFEVWVRKREDSPNCPSCGAEDVERLLSIPNVHSETSRALSMKAAKRRDDRQQMENMRTRLEYEANHD